MVFLPDALASPSGERPEACRVARTAAVVFSVPFACFGYFAVQLNRSRLAV